MSHTAILLDDLNALHATIARLTAERDKARDQLATAQVIIAAMERERDTARELRAALTAERDEALAALREALEGMAEGMNHTIDLQVLRTDHARLTVERDEARASLATVRAQVDTMIAVHDEVESRAVAAEAELARQSAARVAVDAAEAAEVVALRDALTKIRDAHAGACPACPACRAGIIPDRSAEAVWRCTCDAAT